MNMNKLVVRVAVAAALAGSSLPAFALTPSQVPAANRVYIGGATATNGVLRDVFLSSTVGLCQAGTVDVYETSGSNPSQRAVLCTGRSTLSGAFGSLANQPLGYTKESLGGSGNGTQPVANQSNLTFFDLDAANFTSSCASNTAVPAAGGLLAYNLHTGCTPTTSRPPAVGIADVEARLLGASAAEQGRLAPTGLLDIVFGVPVSTPLYRALQTAQGLPTNDDATNVPSLTSGQIIAMYTGNLYDSSLLTGVTGDAGTALPSKAIHICRRGDSSGTQAGTESFFLRQRCEDNVHAFMTPDVNGCRASGCAWPTATVGGVAHDFRDDLVYAGSGSGQAASCLNYFGTQASDNFAIGVLSTETNPLSVSAPQAFRFVRVDGALPTLEQTANGNYKFFTSNVLNRRVPSVLGTFQETIVSYFTNNIGSPAFVAGLNAPFQNAIGNSVGTTRADGGVLATALVADNLGGFPITVGAVTSEPPFSGDEVRAIPINTQTKQPLGAINNCQPPETHAPAAGSIQGAGGQMRATTPTF